MLDVENNNLQT